MHAKVRDAIAERGLEVRVASLRASVETVDRASRAVECTPAQIAKSIVFVADGDPVMCVLSGSDRVDADHLCEVLDCAQARPAHPDEVRAATGFSVGGVSPLAHGLETIVDPGLLDQEQIWASGGDDNTLVCVDPYRLVEATHARVKQIAAAD
jgi:prolyl-tRNA editing enzyme YbaK/EbsC (Cys-tRNA(Pro) deacylase)